VNFASADVDQFNLEKHYLFDRISRMNPSEIQPSPTPSQVERLQTLRQFYEQWTLEVRQLKKPTDCMWHLSKTVGSVSGRSI